MARRKPARRRCWWPSSWGGRCLWIGEDVTLKGDVARRNVAFDATDDALRGDCPWTTHSVGEIVELDINPLLADSRGVIALDARIAVAEAEVSGGARLSISPYPNQYEGKASLRDGTASAPHHPAPLRQ